MIRYVERAITGERFKKPEHISPIAYELLIRRGVRDAAEARAFLDMGEFHDAHLLSGMNAAVTRIKQAIAAREGICVYGDYDVDGVCATAILYSELREMGARATYYMPSRSEGYGLNERAVRDIAGGSSLLITVDLGVTSVELTALAKSLKLDVIVTDHHRPGKTLPDCIVVNPLLDDYPYPWLCGAGVAYKLASALSGEHAARKHIALAGLATIADLVPLTGENRLLAKLALQSMSKSPELWLTSIFKCAGRELGKPVTAREAGFLIAPRLNASGRMSVPETAFELLLTRDEKKALALAELLETANAERKNAERETVNEAIDMMAGFDFIRDRAIVLYKPAWHEGVIGLAASRLAEKYNLPTIILTGLERELTGSARSVRGVDIHKALSGVSTYLTRFGGHEMAAGLRVERSRLPEFTRALNEWLITNVPDGAFTPSREYDMPLTLSEVTLTLISELAKLEPYGMGNPAPVFLVNAYAENARRIGRDNTHMRLTLTRDGSEVPAVFFGCGADAELPEGERLLLLGVSANSFNGRVTAEAEVKVIKPASAHAALMEKSRCYENCHMRFLTQLLYNRGNTPEPTAISLDDLIGELRAKPRGTLVMTMDMRVADELLTAYDGDIDVYMGEFPTDARGFNAVCVCP